MPQQDHDNSRTMTVTLTMSRATWSALELSAGARGKTIHEEIASRLGSTVDDSEFHRGYEAGLRWSDKYEPPVRNVTIEQASSAQRIRYKERALAVLAAPDLSDDEIQIADWIGRVADAMIAEDEEHAANICKTAENYADPMLAEPQADCDHDWRTSSLIEDPDAPERGRRVDQRCLKCGRGRWFRTAWNEPPKGQCLHGPGELHNWRTRHVSSIRGTMSCSHCGAIWTPPGDHGHD